MATKAPQYEAGEYVVTVDRFRKEVFADDDKQRREPIDEEVYEKGDTVELDDRTATRLGRAGSIAKQGTLAARVAQGDVPAQFVPDITLTDDQLAAQREAIDTLLRERQEDFSYDRTAEGGVDPTDGKAVKKALGGGKEGQAKADKVESVRKEAEKEADLQASPAPASRGKGKGQGNS